MAFDYDHIAPHYDVHRRGRGPYYGTLLMLLNEARATSVLEVGAGTGNNTQAIVQDHPCQLTALERSAGMLAQGRSKLAGVQWVQGDAMALPFSAGRFDFAYATYVLHHLSDLDAFFREVRRVLRNGIAAFVTLPRHFILAHPMNAYFPSFSVVDGARFQHEDAVAASMQRAGFSHVTQSLHHDAPRIIDQAYAEKVAGKFISTYALLPEDEFQAGLARLRNEIAGKGALDVTMVREAVTVWGRC
ncbi:MAG: class I SAM-dependent methyltransferase [Candidatus Hydrogenedentes bacterium]|nr:class I SAM-dependent methyltransferase [Candidatus Hydrogenedentota bacterium]